jgi:hypothetical protein
MGAVHDDLKDVRERERGRSFIHNKGTIVV